MLFMGEAARFNVFSGVLYCAHECTILLNVPP